MMSVYKKFALRLSVVLAALPAIGNPALSACHVELGAASGSPAR